MVSVPFLHILFTNMQTTELSPFVAEGVKLHSILLLMDKFTLKE